MERNQGDVTTVASGFTEKKLARQLDFTEHPQAEVQSRLLALAKPSQIIPVVLTPAKPVLLPWKRTMPATMRVAHQLHRPSEQSINRESPKSQAPCNAESKDASPRKQMECNCRYSRCLKLYCACFANGILCDSCNCKNCHNSVENEAERNEAIETILERKPDAFKPKITNSSLGPRVGMVGAHEATIMGKHNRGCNCKKSECRKKYCECFVAKVLCSDNCNCKGCKNVEGSNEKISFFHKGRENALTSANKAVNAAIYTSLPPTKKRKNEQLKFVEKANDDATNRLEKFRQDFLTPPMASSSLSFVPSSGSIANSLGSSNPAYRSLLVDILQLQHLNELCSLLVVVSAEAAKNISEKKHVITHRDIEHVQNSFASSTLESRHVYDRDDIQKLSSSEMDGPLEYACQSVAVDDRQKGRAISPETFALIWDEKDIITTRTDSPNRVLSLRQDATIESTCLHGFNEVDAEQERLVLTIFCDFLNQLITSASMKETLWLPSTRDGLESPTTNSANWYQKAYNPNVL